MATAVERPRARTEGLVIKALPDEVLVHDLARHRTHCLNGPAAAVWRLCDGQRTLGQIARQLGQAPEARWSDEAVRLALDELGRAHLLTDVLTGRPDAGGMTRRQTLQRLAAAAVVVPTVATIVAPRAADAQSVPGAPGTPGTPGTPGVPGTPGAICAPAGQPCRSIGNPSAPLCCPDLLCGSSPIVAPNACITLAGPQPPVTPEPTCAPLGELCRSLGNPNAPLCCPDLLCGSSPILAANRCYSLST
jgi:hypothetical protein